RCTRWATIQASEALEVMTSECRHVVKKRGTLGLAALCSLFLCTSTVSFATQSPAGCNQNRMALDIAFDPQAFVLQGNSITYHITAQNNPTNAADACDADHVLVQFCCPSLSGAPFPFGDFVPNHCVQLSAPGGDTFPAQPPLPPEKFDVTCSSAGVT